MKRNPMTMAFALLGALLWAGSPAWGQEHPKGEHPKGEHPKGEKGGEHPKGEHPGADAWAKAAAPGPEHEVLKHFAGSWTTKAKFVMDPAKPAEESTGTSENTMILGGRFMHQVYKGSMMGRPFEGVGVWGYDNMKKQYTSVWLDNNTTSIMPSTGTYDAATKSFTEIAEEGKMRMVTRIVSDTEHQFEMYGVGPDGKEMKVGEITYTRK